MFIVTSSSSATPWSKINQALSYCKANACERRAFVSFSIRVEKENRALFTIRWKQRANRNNLGIGWITLGEQVNYNEGHPAL